MSETRPAVITLHPGDVAIGSRGDRLETLLGSCVAIVLTDPRRTAGVMCHVVHARAGGTARASGAYADVALRSMAGLLRERGLTASLCDAYVYGGGNMFPGHDDPTAVGDANVDWALHALDEIGAHVLEVDVRGAVYRRLAWTVGPDAPQVRAVPL